MTKKLIKAKNGVYLYENGDNIDMYIDEQLIMSIDKQFKDMLYKSYDNLIKLREA